MLVLRHGRRPVASLALLVAAGASSLVEACASAPPPSPPPIPTPSASVASAATKPRWMPIEAKPERERTRWKVRINKDSELLVDSAGMRWMEPASGAARAETFLPDVPGLAGVSGTGRLVWQDGIGLVLIGDNHKMYLSADPLGELVEKGTVPAGADVATTLIFRGGVGLVVDGKPMISEDLVHWRPVPAMGDRTAVHAVVGRDGKGLALFAPQSLAATNDGGKTWSPLPDDDGPMVKLAVDEEDPTSVLIEPRRPRDQLVRRWHAGGTELELFAAQDGAPARRVSSRMKSRMPSFPRPSGGDWLDQAFEDAPPPRVRTLKGAGLHLSKISIDGDTVVFGAHLRTEKDKPMLAWETSTLGGPVHRVLQPLDALPKNNHPLRIATCAGSVAVTLDRDVRVTDASGAIKIVPVGIVPQRISFFGPRKLLVVGRPEANAAGLDGDGKATEALEIDLDAPDPKASLKSTKLESGDDHGTGTLVGGCAVGTKSAWLMTYGKGIRLQTLRDGAWSTVIKPDKEASGTPDVLAIEPDGTLVLLELGEKSGRVMRVTPTGEVTTKDTGFKLTTQLLVGDPSSRHALTMDSDGHAHQTDDAGETWTQLVDPPAAARKVHRVVLCGATRCEIDDLAVHVGWEPDAVPPPPSPPDEKSTGAAGNGTEATAPAPIALTCTVDKGASPRLPPTIEGVHGIAAGRGDVLWAGVAAAKSLRDSDPTHFLALDGKADGSVTSHELGRSLPERDGFWFANESIGAVFVLRTPTPEMRVETVTYAVSWQHDPSKPPKKYTFKSLWLGAEAFTRAMQTDDGFALIDVTEQKIHWFHDSGTVTVRNWPGVLTGRVTDLIGARMVEAASGTWYALIPAGETLEVGDVTATVSLVAIDPTGGRKFRTFRLSPSGLEERGLGLVKDGQGVSLAVVERTTEGGLELRLRPVHADLSLGSAKGVPGAKSAAGKILTLPACGPTPQGETLTLMTDDEAAVTVDGSDHAGVMMRRARVTAASACIERTMITRTLANELDNLLPHENENEIVIAGNGEGAGVLQDKADNEPTGLTALKCSVTSK